MSTHWSSVPELFLKENKAKNTLCKLNSKKHTDVIKYWFQSYRPERYIHEWPPYSILYLADFWINLYYCKKIHYIEYLKKW